MGNGKRTGSESAQARGGRGMTVTMQRETFADAYEDMLPLLHQHWREVAHFSDIPLNVDVESYVAMDSAGRLRVYTLRADSKLVGYVIFTVGPNSHYKQSLQAQGDVIYVHPDYRRGRLGIELIQWSDSQLALEGVQAVYHHVKVQHPALGVLLQRMGYVHVDSIYTRRLD